MRAEFRRDPEGWPQSSLPTRLLHLRGAYAQRTGIARVKASNIYPPEPRRHGISRLEQNCVIRRGAGLESRLQFCRELLRPRTKTRSLVQPPGTSVAADNGLPAEACPAAGRQKSLQQILSGATCGWQRFADRVRQIGRSVRHP